MICGKGARIDELMDVSRYRDEFTYGSCGTSTSSRRRKEAIDDEFMDNEQYLCG